MNEFHPWAAVRSEDATLESWERMNEFALMHAANCQYHEPWERMNVFALTQAANCQYPGLKTPRCEVRSK